MAEDLCSRCGRRNITGCDGSGYIRVDESTVEQCPNIYRRQLMQHLGTEIAGVTHTSNTPLLRLNPEGGTPLYDSTTKNLVIECSWRGLLPHLKYVLGFKGTRYYHRIITDERIKNVFVGSESYKSRSARVRDDLDTFNNIADLVGSDYHLIIIKLGYLGYQNRAAPGALKEALLHRESINKPTWLVVDYNRPWVHSHDPDVAQYVDDHFERLKIEAASTTPAPEPNVGMSDAEEEPPTSLEHYVVDEEPAQEPDTSGLGADIELPGAGQPDRRRYKGWKR